MPEVIIKARDEWFPSDEPEKTAGSERRHTEKQELTIAIAQKMPDLVAGAFHDLSLGLLKPGEVVFDIVKFHALCSTNQPDIAITISPSWTEEREAAKAGLVANIRHELRSFIIVDAEREPGSETFPSIDIMVKFVNEAGVALDNRGETTSHW